MDGDKNCDCGCEGRYPCVYEGICEGCGDEIGKGVTGDYCGICSQELHRVHGAMVLINNAID